MLQEAGEKSKFTYTAAGNVDVLWQDLSMRNE